MRSTDRWPTVGVGLAALLLYGLTASTTVQGGDAGELLTVAATGGVAHPPGYPLFSALAGWLVAIPLGPVPWRAAMAAGLLAAAGVALVTRAVQLWTGHALAAVAAGGTLALSTLCWRYATVSEVFAGGVFTAGAVLAVAAKVDKGWAGPAPCGALGLAIATGIANHHTVVLLAPIVLWTLWLAARERPVAGLVAGAAGLVPGFLAYLRLMAPGGTWRWGETESWGGLAHHFLRRDYGTFSLAISDAEVAIWAHPVDWAAGLPLEFAGLGFLLGTVGLVVGLRQRTGTGLALLATLLLTGPVFFLRFNLPVEGFWTVVTSRFHLLPNTVFAVFVGLGTAAWLDSPVLQGRALRVAGVVAALALSALQAVGEAPHRGWTVLEDHGRNVLQVVEPHALILGNGDSRLFAMLYLQEVEGLRPDVAYVEPDMVGYPWYRARLNARHPGLLPEGEDQVAVPLERLAAAHYGQRPIYLAPRLLETPGVQRRLPPAYPYGAVLMRLVGPGETPPEPRAVEAQLESSLAGFTLRSRVETPHQASQTWESEAWDQYAITFDILADAFEGAGDSEGASRCRARAAELSPHRFGH